jgi:hypothetical protein
MCHLLYCCACCLSDDELEKFSFLIISVKEIDNQERERARKKKIYKKRKCGALRNQLKWFFFSSHTQQYF